VGEREGGDGGGGEKVGVGDEGEAFWVGGGEGGRGGRGGVVVVVLGLGVMLGEYGAGWEWGDGHFMGR
jgi:hypothetical protein